MKGGWSGSGVSVMMARYSPSQAGPFYSPLEALGNFGVLPPILQLRPATASQLLCAPALRCATWSSSNSTRLRSP